MDKPLRRTRSTIDLSREEGTKSGPKDTDAMRKTLLRNAQETAGDDDDPDLAANASSRKVAFVTPPMASSQSDVGAGEDADEPDMAVEWLMVTRSDPGGSVPRFIVEKGTPSGIVNDANRFVTWLLSSNSADDSAADDERAKDGEMLDEASVKAATIEPAERWSDRVSCSPARPAEEPAPTGFFGMIAGALGAAGIAGSAMTTSRGTMSSKDLDGHDSDDGSETRTETESHLSSALDYASAEEGETLPPLIAHDGMPDDGHSVRSKGSDVSQQSRSVATDSVAAAAGATAGAMVQHEKELRKIEERYRRAQEKVAKMQQAKKQKEGGGGGGADQDQRSQEAAALSKLQEKHKRDMARQEERYRRGLEKLEARRAAEERKAAERRRKAQERQDRANVAAELERARAERDVARKQIEMLTVQVGELQRQNTALAARIGRLQGPGEAL